MWFIFAIITIFLWGGADLFYKLGSDERDRYSHLKIVIIVGLIMGIHAISYIFFYKIQYDIVNILYYLPVSLLYILSMTIGYFGLRYIELSVSSPVGNSSGAVAFILCIVFLKESVTLLQSGAVFVISLGIFLLAVFYKKSKEKNAEEYEKEDKKYHKGLLAFIFPVLYCIIDGLGTFADALILNRYMDETQALVSYELTFLLISLTVLFYLSVIKKERIIIVQQKERIAAGILETAGQFFYIGAMARNAVFTVPVVACYSVASVVFSRLFLKEKLKTEQYVVIGAIIAAIGILGME